MLDFLIGMIISDGFLVVMPIVFIALGFLGWKRGQRWARVLVWLLVIALVAAAVLGGLYVWALGQANWSL